MVNQSHSYITPSPHVMSILTYVTIFTSLSGVCLNGIVLVMFMMNRSLLKKPANILIFSITLSDLLQSTTASPILLFVLLHKGWIVGEQVCTLYAFLMTWFGLISITNLSTLSVERYLSLKNVMRSAKTSARSSVLAACFLWFYCLFWATMPALGWSGYVLDSSKLACSVKWHSAELIDLSYNTALLICCFLIPSGTIVVSYYLMSHLIRTLSKRAITNWGRQSCYTRVTIKNERMMQRLTVTMTLAFFIAWTPYATICLMAVMGYTALVSTSMETIAAFVAKSSTVYNPIIYVFIYKDFKTIMWKTLRRRSTASYVSSIVEIAERNSFKGTMRTDQNVIVTRGSDTREACLLSNL